MTKKVESNEGCDLLVFAAHPDDAELCCGGLLLVSSGQGWRTGVVDATRGELGSLGTPETRDREAAEAARILGLSCRRNLGLPDGHVRDCDESRREVVRTIRELRPLVVVAPPLEDHHPDHMAVGELVRQSLYLCGIRNYLPGTEPWRPRALLHYAGSRPVIPRLVVDISDVIDRRMEAVRCYRSQFEPPADGRALRINVSYFLEAVLGHLRHYGSLIGVPYGEAYTSELPLPISDLVTLFGREPWKER